MPDVDGWDKVSIMMVKGWDNTPGIFYTRHVARMVGGEGGEGYMQCCRFKQKWPLITNTK
jgi:hypothetical protein